jgi:hypothetical protein
MGGAQTGPPDLDATESVLVALAFRGPIHVDLRRYPFHLGRALHALEDSFSHSFRTADELDVDSVLNYVDWAIGGNYVPARDGYHHIAALDRCTDAEPAQQARVTKATEAATALIGAMAQTGEPAERLSRAQAVLDTYLTLHPGCDATNQWCDAPELREDTGSCTTIPPGRSAPVPLALLVVGGMAVVAGRRRVCSPIALVAWVLLQAAGPGVAHAQSWSLAGDVSVSADHGALAGSLGVRRRLSSHFVVGADAEYNPWFSIDAGRFAAGAFNAYGTLVGVWTRLGSTDLQSTLHVGVSVLLFDLVGANAGATGLYFGIAPLGVTLHADRRLRFMVNPLELSVPAPQLAGVPYYYRQYRATAGLEWEL